MAVIANRAVGGDNAIRSEISAFSDLAAFGDHDTCLELGICPNFCAPLNDYIRADRCRGVNVCIQIDDRGFVHTCRHCLRRMKQFECLCKCEIRCVVLK